jgi:hypothetical protein
VIIKSFMQITVESPTNQNHLKTTLMLLMTFIVDIKETNTRFSLVFRETCNLSSIKRKTKKYYVRRVHQLWSRYFAIKFNNFPNILSRYLKNFKLCFQLFSERRSLGNYLLIDEAVTKNSASRNRLTKFKVLML